MMRYLALKKSPIAGVLLLASIFSGCESWEEEDRQARILEARAVLGDFANDPNAFPHGRKAPPLAADEQAEYREVAELFRTGKNDPQIFDTTHAVDCELSAETQALVAHQQTATGWAIAQRENEQTAQTRTLSSALQVRLLQGKVEGGVIDGPFDAVTNFQYTVQLATDVQSVAITKRVRGEMREGKLHGPLTVVQFLSSSVGRTQALNWSASKMVFADNESAGLELSYSEHPQFNTLQISRKQPNGLWRTRSYAGSELNMAYDSFEGKIYGFLEVYSGGKILSRSCFWAGQPAADTVGWQYLAGSKKGRQVVERTGMGLFYPGNARGAFSIQRVPYPGPAAEAGLLPGDTVLAVGGQMLTALHDAQAITQMLTGPAGSAVEIQYLREGEAQPRTVKVVRGTFRSVQLEPVAE